MSVLVELRRCAAIGFIVAVTTAAFKLGAASTLQTRDSSNHQDVHRVKDVSQLRPANGEERALAKFFDQRVGPNLLEWGHITTPGPEHDPPPPPPPPGYPPPPPGPDPFVESICRSDAILVGQSVASKVLLNASETFLFTVHTVSVSQWIRPSGTGATASVAVFGGRALVGERMLTAIPGSLPSLRRAAILRLKRVPNAAGFALIGDPLHVDAEAVKPTPEIMEPLTKPGVNKSAPIERVRAILAKCGAKY